MKQEPVGWWNEKLRIHWQDAVSDTQEANWNTPLYTESKELNAFSDEELIDELKRRHGDILIKKANEY